MIHNKTEFALYMDESGSAKPSPRDAAPYFAVGGVLVKRQDESVIANQIIEFKRRWEISENTALHGNEIRSRKKNFAWLGLKPKEEQDAFLCDLSNTITCCPIIVHACVVSRQGYLKRYFERYGEKTWEMLKSAFMILIERSAKYASQNDGKLMVYYEKAGKNEDRLMEEHFDTIRSEGHPFALEGSAKYDPLSPGTLDNILCGIEGKTKQNLLIQVADLCLHPVVRAKDQSENTAFQALRQNQRLVDSVLQEDQLPTMGIKYYCFEDP
ncbi:MAG: DUF3800 domain-containing protein [Myxacorys chilensis ATA2-1-KO14]|nr:DUF3800 domain-containing protein [Myxacorys chilensis ATA2-1-KO14]